MSATFVVGYDGSACADAALAAALQLGAEMGAGVVLAFGYYANPVGGEVTDYRKALEEHGRRLLADAVARNDAGGVDVETVVVEDQPAEALVALARERDARAIIVGTRGESPVRAALYGSTPHKLLQLSDRPVLVVPE